MPLTLIITEAGRAALINAANTGTLPITITQAGLTETAVTPTTAITALAGEFARIAAVAGDVVANDTIHVTITDAGVGAYSLRSFALYLGDGTLFAVYGQPTPILTKTASSIAQIAVDMTFADITAASITFGDTDWLNPPATTERQGVAELATNAEAATGTDTARVLTPAAAKFALLTWLLGIDGSGSGIDADLLDGQHGSYYTNIIARLGYTPLNAAIYTAADVLAKLLTLDGSGSGLDADLWRGQTPAQFLAAQFPSGSNANGNWRKEPDGSGGFFIRQWGTGMTGNGYGPGNDGWSAALTLPIPFTDAATVQLRAWPKTLNATAIDGDSVVGELLSLSTYRLGSEDNARIVFWEAFGK